MLTEVENGEVTHVAKQSHLKGKHWVPKSPTIRYSNSLRLGTLSDVQWTPNSKKKSARFLYSSRQTIVSFMSTEGESDEVTHAAKQFFKQCVTQSKQMWPLLEPTTRNTHVSRHNLGLGHLLY